MKSPLVSIILPYRNASPTIFRCLLSISSQTFRNWELIAIDDNSSDDTAARINDFFKGNPKLVHLRLGKAGIVNALNLGIEQSKGSLLARMDADDEMHPDRLLKQVAFLSKNERVGLVASRVSYRKDKDNFCGEGYRRYVDWSNQVVRESDIRLRRFEESPIVHPTVVFRKTLVHSLGGYRQGPFPEDYELWLRWMSKGVVLAKLEEYLLNWFDHQKRSSRNDPRYSTQSFQELKAEYFRSWLFENHHLGKRICIWGAGRLAKRQISFLLGQKLEIDKIYEVDPRKIGTFFNSIPIVGIDGVRKENGELILVLTGSRKAKLQISDFLTQRKLIYGRDYIYLV